MPFRHRQRVRSGTTAAEASAFGAARREARVVGEGAAGDEKESVHDWAGFSESELHVRWEMALTARQVVYFRSVFVVVTSR